MIKFEFAGWVDNVFPSSQYEASVAVRNYKTATDRETMRAAKEYPMCYKFTARAQSGEFAKVQALNKNDEVKITAYVTGRGGISKAGNYYCINEIVIAKNGLTLINRAKKEEEASIDDCPF